MSVHTLLLIVSILPLPLLPSPSPSPPPLSLPLPFSPLPPPPSHACLQMISAERLMAYGQLQPEAPLETPPGVERPPKTWPHSGAIRMHEMRFRYAADTPYVLNNMSMEIGPGEKVVQSNRHSCRTDTMHTLSVCCCSISSSSGVLCGCCVAVHCVCLSVCLSDWCGGSHWCREVFPNAGAVPYG